MSILKQKVLGVEDLVAIERAGRVAILRLVNPPLNLLGPYIRAQLAEQFGRLVDDPEVNAIVLTGGANTFSEGHNQLRPEKRFGGASLAAICLQIEDSPKPVIACLTGAALGAGLELALAAHRRVAQADTRIGMTDIALGVIPGAGGTQRLSRLVGAQTTLKLLLSGMVIKASDPHLAVVMDKVVETDALNTAIALAQDVASAGGKLVKTRDRRDGFKDSQAFLEAIKSCRAAFGPHTRFAQHAILRTVENALVLPFMAGQAMEDDLYKECLASDDAQGNLHMILAVRRLVNLPEAGAAKPQAGQCLGIVGAGPAAISLVLAALESGLPTVWFERDEAAANAAKARLEQRLDAQKMPTDQWYALMQRLTVTHDPQRLTEADLVIEAVADNAQTKQQVMEWLAGIMPSATILVTHSATLPVDQIAEASGRAGQVVGMYGVPGAHRARLAELIPGSKTSAVATMTLHAVLNRIGISAIRCGSQGGTIGARMVAACRDAADFALDLGATPGQVDKALVGFGKANGVFGPLDMVGLEHELAQAMQTYQASRYPSRHLARLRELIAEGRTGRAAGKGFYDWVNGVPQARSSDRPRPDAPDAETIAKICLGAMMNEGARLLREGVALRASDIDVVMVRSHGFPAWRGGVMNAADQLGLFTLQQATKPYAEAAPRLFALDPGIDELIWNGEGFAVLNGVGAKRRRIAGAV